MRYWICLILVTLPLLVEYVRLKRWREAVPVRIHVHGTRGKTSTTRMLAAILRQRGHRVLAKTTGDAPEYILPDGSVQPVRRWAPARIQEHVNVLRMAARLRADIVVVEGMALQPETVFQSEQILRATHAIITNVRPDHLETMSAGRRGVLRTLSLMLPKRGTLYTPLEAGATILRARAEKAGIPCLIVPTPSAWNQSGALAAAVAAGMEDGRSTTDVGDDHLDDAATSRLCADREPTRTVTTRGVAIRFYDFLSANDVVSARLLWHLRAAQCGDDCLRVALLATRADRPLRTRAFMDWLCGESGFDLVVPAGDHAWYAVLHGARTARQERRRLLAVANPWTRPGHVLERLCGLARQRGCRKLVVVGLGNAHGFGMHWRTYVAGLDTP